MGYRALDKLVENRGSLIVAVVMVASVLWVLVSDGRAASERDVAFHVSEAGVHYVLHLLNSGACRPSELAAQRVVQSLAGTGETSGEALGVFSVEVDPGSDDATWEITARGKTEGVGGGCQTIRAEVAAIAGSAEEKYRVVSWSSNDRGLCGWWRQPAPVVCEGNSLE